MLPLGGEAFALYIKGTNSAVGHGNSIIKARVIQAIMQILSPDVGRKIKWKKSG